MTLKRSFSKKLKNTITRTKQIVSPTIGSKRPQSFLFNNNNNNNNSNNSNGNIDDELYDDDDYSQSSYSNSIQNNSLTEPSFHGLGIFKDSNEKLNLNQNITMNNNINNSNNNGASNVDTNNHTPTNSISSIQKSVSHIISIKKISNLNDQSLNEQDDQPTLLYSGKRKSNSIRRNKSIQQKHPLDFIDTSNNLNISLNLIPTPNSLNSNSDVFNYDQSDNLIKNNDNLNSNENKKNHNNDIETNKNIIINDTDDYDSSSLNSFKKDDEVILLPIDPVDKSIPPCTTEQLTPILPINLDSSNNINNGYFNLDYNNNINDKSNPINIDYIEKPPLIVSNLSSNTTTTINTSSTENTKRTSISINGSPIRISFSNIQKNYTTTDYNLHEIIQHDANSIFTKSNQIDHLDKALDIKKNDQLADQMALNILQNITEENVDELSKLKEEISMKF